LEHSDPEHSSRFRRRRFPAAWATAVLLLTISPLLPAHGPSNGNPLEVIERAFRDGEAGRLRQIAGKEEKILIDSETLGFSHGYYSIDQVCLVLESIFRSRSTTQFNFLSGAKTPEQKSHIAAVGRWMYRTGRSRAQSAQIAFTLVRRNGAWTLKEIRDVP
jgi:hypothetical protein